ncbi:LysR substrate-binding domain-containing protein [Devosia rhodophyticola]|uniref:LysR substrate-binding domain-containing protein n=1 Tax=Devosia rhodophyticola TaxID=3026423 RepID=A0ABY7Z2Q8_9HYPH|nr:LysR substrate-binding domain-containing protein [Devosia rhodophyticola]WDR07275.1 LysR substrate-binding domain-containing protein [Devosia rhodophyticola]
MEMRQIRYFVAVAEELNFGRAARRENISQPPLSIQIKNLETELGLVLFERTKRSVKLTEAGSVFLTAARAILATAAAGTDAAQRAHRGETGEITIGFVHSASVNYLSSLVGAFRRDYPDISFKFHEATVSEQIEALDRGAIDVGIIRPPVERDDIEAFTVVREGFYIAVPRSHRLFGQNSVKLEALRNDRFVFYPPERSPAFHRQLIGMCTAAGFLPDIAVQANTMYTAIGLAGAGAGVAIIPESLTVVAVPSVGYLKIEAVTEFAELCLAFRKGNQSRATQSLLDFARSQT